MVNGMYEGTLSIDWLENEYEKYEDSFLLILNENKGYLMQALHWLKSEPRDVTHRVQISLDVSETPIIGDFYLELNYEPDGKAMINIISMENESIIGFVRFPPQDTFSLEDWNKLGERYLELLKTMDRELLPEPRIAFDVSHSTYGRLVTLSEHFDRKVSEIASDIIEASSSNNRWIINRVEDYKVHMEPINVLSNLLFAGRHFTDSVINSLLDMFDAKGLFVLDDMDVNLDEMRMWISFEALSGIELYVHSFDVSFNGLSRLDASYHMDKENVDDLFVSRMKEMVANLENSITLPDSFLDVMEFNVEINDEDEDSLILQVDITEETLDALPSILDISDLFKKILNQARARAFL